MKKRISAGILSLILAVSPAAVYAQETDVTTTEAIQPAADFEETDEMEAAADTDVADEMEAAADTDTADEMDAAADTQNTDKERDYDEIIVANTTQATGGFFTRMWSNVTVDLDVQSLLHGYNLVEWSGDEGFFRTDPSVVSGIAVSDNQAGDRTYVITTYRDLVYSDETPITAADYAFSILLMIAPEVEEIGGSVKNMDYLVGYDDYLEGRTPYLAGVRILNDYMLSITVSHEYLPFFYELGLLDCTPFPISVIAPGCMVRDDGNGVYITNIDPEIEEPIFTAELLQETILDPETGYLTHPSVVSGPYVLTSFEDGKAEFEINEFYKGNSDGIKPSIDRVVLVVDDNETMVSDLKNGEVGLLNRTTYADTIQDGTQLVAETNREDYKAASDWERFAMSNYSRIGLSYICFCCKRDLVNSEKIRQAIAWCLDKDKLVEDYVSNYGLRVEGYYGLGQWMYRLINKSLPYPVKEPEDEDDEEAKSAYEKELAAWEELTLDDIPKYELDVETAVKLLVEEGWTGNREGDPFDPEKDDVRCKKIDDEWIPLELKMIVPEETEIAEQLETTLTEHLKEAGVLLIIEPVDSDTLFKIYYSQEERDCDMIYLATNFTQVFDPSEAFRPDEEEEEEEEEEKSEDEGEGEEAGEDDEELVQNTYNTSGVQDEELYRLAVDMRKTEPGETLEYCQKWMEFQKHFAKVLPMIPVYSNVYFDFYPRILRNYNVSEYISWAQAIVYAYIGDAPDEDEKPAEETDEEAAGTEENTEEDSEADTVEFDD